jgi:EAL domain-containing protein (putative c-di-GMP-specific phosphodiesterase class I)
MAITLGLAKKIDQYVLEKTAKYLEKNLTHIVSVNISTGFCIDRVSLIWFRQFLNTRRYLKNNLVFELHESTLIQYPEICLDIAGLLKGMNYAFGIDQFTLNESALDLLKKLNPDYIKVDHGYLYDAENVINTELALNALITITESLDIKLIAAKIENNEQRKMLSEKNIDYFQGSGVSEITPLTT